MNEQNKIDAELLEAQKAGRIIIFIDRERYEAPKEVMTGAELKALGHVNSNFDLFLVEPGPKDDELIEDNTSVTLKPGTRFVSAPRDLNPGGSYATS
jgi:hypothetical protein